MIKSLDKLLSSTNCKLALCVLLVVFVLYILNRFTCSKENFMGLGNTLSSRSENEYRRVKLKYGRQKLKRMGLDPGKYSEDFIFALKITLDEVNVDIQTAAKLVGDDYSLTVSDANSNQLHMVDLQMKNNFDQLKTDAAWSNESGHDSSSNTVSKTGKLFMTANTASLTLKKLLVFIRYKPLNIEAPIGPMTQDLTKSITAFYEATTLYGKKDNLLFICMWGENNVADKFTQTSDFGLIHGFSTVCRYQSGVEPDHAVAGHQAYYDDSNCLSDKAAAIAEDMKSSNKDSSGQPLASGFSYQGGRRYITNYAHIVKLPTADKINFGGKSIPEVITPQLVALPNNFSNKGTFPAELLNTKTFQEDQATDAQRLSNRIIDLMNLTGANKWVKALSPFSDIPTMISNKNQPYLGCILALIDITNMAEKFTISNMDVVFELISTGRT